MPAPKAVKTTYKQGKTEVTYESNVDASQYYIFELTRAALRDVGKFVTLKFREAYYSHFKKHTGNAGKATGFKVWSSKSTLYPRVQIGLRKIPGFYAYFQEFGTKDGRVPKLGLLSKVVKDNTDEIVKIESQYLTALEDEAIRLKSLIDEGEYEDDGEI